MKQQNRFLLIGGDVRQAYLGRLLTERGAQVSAVGLERYPCEGCFTAETDLREACKAADVLLLPLPVMQGRGLLNAPLANAPYRITDVLDAIPVGAQVFGGAVPQMVQEMAKRRAFEVRDYLAQEELALRNAIPTAEGAIQIAMQELPITLHGAQVLILGSGRIGSALAPRLAGLGAKVTVSARKYADFAKIASAGYAYVDTRALYEGIGRFDVLFNTVPAAVLTRELLARSREQVLIIDLASGNGGVERGAEELRRVIHALSLPGKVAPLTAAADICMTIEHMRKEEQVQ